MNLEGHLLYVDITQICGIGCRFCMYADKHGSGVNMKLTDRAKENMRNMINGNGLKRISVSGEGEPLNNIETFKEILHLSNGGRSFEFITSGFLPHEKLFEFYEETNRILIEHGDTCNIRLSSDSYHIEKIKHKPHGASIRYLLERQPEAISFSFRSVDTDKVFTRNYLVSELARYGLSARIEAINVLEDRLITTGGKVFNIDYKNLVNPPSPLTDDYLDLQSYIKAIEEKTGKVFTLGSLNSKPLVNGMDITIKPNGDVFFYGIENFLTGNINIDDVSLKSLQKIILDTPFIKKLYTTPFMTLIEKLSDDDHAREIIKKVNNPYWLIKELAHHQEDILDRVLAL